MKKMMIVIAVVALATPALAQVKSAAPDSCTEAKIAGVDASIAKMKDGDNKTKATNSTTAARTSLSQQDQAGCNRHLMDANAAMKGRPAKK